MAVDAWGITDGYWSSDRVRVDTTPETRAALAARDGGRRASRRSARAITPDVDRAAGRHRRPVERGRPAPRGRLGRRRREGAASRSAARLPPPHPARRVAELAARGRAGPRAPVGERVWGWAAQLYAARSRASWGIGDLGDLARLARWSSSLGCAGPGAQPAARRRPRAPAAAEPLLPRESDVEEPARAPVEAIPGAAASSDELARLANAGRALERTKAHRSRRSVPAQASRVRPASSRGGRRTRRKQSVTSSLRSVPLHGDDLRLFAIYCALAERHGGGWQRVATELSLPEDRARRALRPGARVAACGCTCGSSGSSTCSWLALPRAAASWSAISRSASTPAARTHGCGKTCSLSMLTSAPRPTASTSRDRTGDFRRSSRGSSARRTSIRSSRPCGQRCAA